MIKFIESKEDVHASEDNPFGCKILSAVGAYGVGKMFARFWIQDGGSTLAQIDDAAVLEDHRADWEEMAGFLQMLDVKTVSCFEEAAEALELPVASRGEIMLLRRGNGKSSALEAERDPSPRDIYALLCAARSETFTPPEFEPFYMDFSYRTRHGAAMSIGIRINGTLVACALCTAMTEHAAVLSGVAVLPQHRRKGLGRSAVTVLAGLLNRERIYILREDGENGEFYRSMGFVPDGRWAEICL